MNEQKYAIRAGAAWIAFAMFLRLWGGGFFAPVGLFLEEEWVGSALIFLTTGRLVGLPKPPAPQQTVPTAPPPETAVPTEPVISKPVFTAADAQAVPVSYGCTYRPDIPALMQQSLQWDLTGDAPTVLIVHTHASEAYRENAADGCITMDDDSNMISVGDEVQRLLEAGGIRVIHDRTHHECPDYNDAYNSARKSINAYLEQYPSITMVLDIHRDAVDGADLTTHALVDGLPSSQIMILVGTDWAGGYHPNWQQNLSVGLKLAAWMERQNPGITRAVKVYPHRLNMDKTMGSLLVEIGASGDSREMALRAAGELAQAILALSRGC